MTQKVILSIAGLDVCGGAGIDADIKTITALGAYGCNAITGIAVENTQRLDAVYPVSPTVLRDEIAIICEDMTPDAVKIGMIATPDQVPIIRDAIATFHLSPVVLDPVRGASCGGNFTADYASILSLFPRVRLVTPNLSEAEIILGKSIDTREDMAKATQIIGEKYNTAVLLKGGHATWGCADALWDGDTLTWIDGEYIATGETHGTGCTLSAAIATYLTRGKSLRESVIMGKRYIENAIRARVDIGKGSGIVGVNFDNREK